MSSGRAAYEPGKYDVNVASGWTPAMREKQMCREMQPSSNAPGGGSTQAPLSPGVGCKTADRCGPLLVVVAKESNTQITKGPIKGQYALRGHESR